MPDESTHVEARIDDWRKRLIDLSNRNRLIAYKPTVATTLSIRAPQVDELLADPARSQPWDFYFPPEEDEDDASVSDTASTVDDIVVHAQERRRARRANEIEVTEPRAKRIARILDNLAKRSNTEFQDKALRILYVAAGFLDWRDPKQERDISSPLVLVPVELRRESTRAPYRMYFVDDEDIVINPSLTEKLRRDAGLGIPDDWAWEDKGIAVELDEIRAAISRTGWTVRNEAVVGLFSFQKYVMYRDLLDNELQVATHPVVRSLAHGRLDGELRDRDPDVPQLEELDEAQLPSSTLSILDADASQRRCVEAAKRGRSFVMQGPPGTGKSQTIANVIAEAIGQGKRVLFVSEKAAALDVVHKRLSVSGLDEYCLMLHGEHAGRREVVQALDRTLSSGLRARPGLKPAELDRLANLRELLNGSAELLHLPQGLLGGRTVREVQEELATLYEAPSGSGAPAASGERGADLLASHQQLRGVFEELSERWHVSGRDYVWRDFGADRFTADDRGRVSAILRELETSTRGVTEIGEAISAAIGMPGPDRLRGAKELLDLVRHLHAAPALDASWLTWQRSQSLATATKEAAQAYRDREVARARYATVYPGRPLDDFARTTSAELAALREGVGRVCGWPPGWEQLAALPAALRHLERFDHLLDEVADRYSVAAERLGQPTDTPSFAQVQRVIDLADLAFSADQRPEQKWLVHAGMKRAEGTLESVGPSLESYQRIRDELLADYLPQVLELEEPHALRQRFEHEHTGTFAKLKSGYRRDAKLIRAVRKDGKLPATPVDDLNAIAEAQELGTSIDREDRLLTESFGSFARGRDTDPSAVSEGLFVAKRATELADRNGDLAGLAGAICVGSVADPDIALAGDQLRAARDTAVAEIPGFARYLDDAELLTADTVSEAKRRMEAIRPTLAALAGALEHLDRGSSSPSATYDEAAARGALVDELHSREKLIGAQEASWRDAIGARFAEDETEFDVLETAASWLGDLFDQVGVSAEAGMSASTNRLPEVMASGLVAVGHEWPGYVDLNEACNRMDRAGAALIGLFEPSRSAELQALVQDHPTREIDELADALYATLEQLHDWTEWRRWRRRADELKWGDFVDGLIDSHVAASDVVPAFHRSFWNRQLEALFDDDPELAEDLRGGAFQRWVSEFRELDRGLVNTGADRLIAERERGRKDHLQTPGSEVELLRREARKMRRHLPVRVLLARIPQLLSELKPCLMMSPLTVSHFLAPDHQFDLVVFDEASQVPPQDAINCIYRGKQLIVAGDSKQLPPTPFFQIAELDELAPDEEDSRTEEDMESVLDACESLLPSQPLRWHYRSRAEPLIAFSNEHIYKGSLVTFPSAFERSGRMGLRFTYVPDGVYDRGRTASNRREAQVVAEKVAEYLSDGSRRSVGVIAFNTAQAAAIGEELDLLKLQNPELEEHFHGDRLDGVFVKHLEAVQGDERDVIVFSVGYGRDGAGKFSMNFGPLNKTGGQRRLNVAVTRARERVELVASVLPHEFQLSDDASAGARMLRDYIAYARAGGHVPADDAPDETEEPIWPSPLEEQIGRAIHELGYAATPEVGVGSFKIDIGVRVDRLPERYLLGIETDGEAYAATPTARDRERLRHEVLRNLGWGPIHRIWSLDWVRTRSAEIDRLRDALMAAEARADAADSGRQTSDDTQYGAEIDHEPSDAPRERIEREVQQITGSRDAALLPWTTTYQRATLRPGNSGYEFHESVNRRHQADDIESLLEVEAPVSVDYAIRRLAENWGLQRAGHRVVAASRQAISQVTRRGRAQIRGDFIWLPEQSIDTVRVPDPTDETTRRSIEDIPPEEIDLALARLAESSTGLDGDALVTQAARVLGFDRTGDRIRKVIDARVAEMGTGR